MKKICNYCGQLKPLLSFKKHGNYYLNKCKSCYNLYMRNNRKENPIKLWCSSTINKHRSNGYIVNIRPLELYDFVKDIKTCEICGCDLKWEGEKQGRQLKDSPTLDRVDNEQILTLNNIQILCAQCNVMKGNRPMNEFIAYCNMVGEKYGKTQSI